MRPKSDSGISGSHVTQLINSQEPGDTQHAFYFPPMTSMCGICIDVAYFRGICKRQIDRPKGRYKGGFQVDR